MIDKTRLHLILKEYKKDFPKLFWTSKTQNEKYKWIAVKHFQDNWDIDAPDFLEMFTRATAKTENLLAAMNYFPRGMIMAFCKVAPEDVRKMFRELFDESKSVVTRVENFIKESERLRVTYKPEDDWKAHYQNTNSVTTYLWLRYPDKYYIYKYSECKAVASELDNSYKPTKGAKPETLLGAIKLYDEIAEYIATDSELVNLMRNSLDDTCYPDANFRTLAIDVGFYISRYYSKGEKPFMTKVDHAWYVGAVIDDVDMLDTFIAEGRWENGYEDKHLDDVLNMKPGDKIAIKSSYTKKKVPFKTNGAYVSVMGIKAIGTVLENKGDGRNVKVKWEKVFDPVKEWYFFTMRSVLWYVDRKEEFWGYGALLDFTFADVEQDYEKFLSMPGWKEQYGFELTDENSEIMTDVAKNTILYGPPGTGKTYNTVCYAVAVVENKLLEDVISEASIGDGYEAVFSRYNVYKEHGLIAFTTFHQSYGYEEFIEGIKPVINDAENSDIKYAVTNGVFKDFCEQAETINPQNRVFIIDEINRGNISKIFGELITLVEPSKRVGADEGIKAVLPYSKKPFGIPENVYILGTMNTADRSIATLDTALRRRFDFVEMMPNTKVLEGIEVDCVNISVMLEKINERISVLFDREHTIGHAYFIGLKDSPDMETLANIFRNKVIPLLQEYFYEDYERIRLVLADNQVSETEKQFIIAETVDSVALFGNSEIDILDDTKRYIINDNAFENADAYMKIYSI